MTVCPRCHGKGTIVKDGPSEWEYDSAWPCPVCTTDRTALKGTGHVDPPTPALDYLARKFGTSALGQKEGM